MLLYTPAEDLQGFKRLHGVVWFRANRVVGISREVANLCIPVNDESGRHRQRPRVVTIEASQIDSKLCVYAS